ncbi:putative MATE family efflux protein [Balneicella halophila]|uniref:Multidrug-efflux transporter n=1 Tax=Balneicella halophila TaxID=1537566 RepID=A0A7L4UP83_BALHA|nr:MATE family efflux transporter [Balneicella halophila]PVX50844.1 putative MATE family efflux protein [Balneicella halophila]
MAQINQLTKGNISSQLVKLAIPVILTSFVQMSYNLVDMAILGSLGSEIVSGVGTAFYIVWVGRSIIFFTKLGGEVNIAQSIGRDNLPDALKYIRNATTTALLLSSVYAFFIYLMAPDIIGLFGIENPKINEASVKYLSIVAIGMPFSYTNLSFTGTYNGIGNTKIPLLVTSIGLGINLVLDPCLILGWGPFPKWGVAGAAYATVISQMIVFVTFLLILYFKQPFKTRLYFLPLHKFHFDLQYLNRIFKIGGPLSLQSLFLAFVTMVMAKIVINAAHGDGRPISVQSIGAQIEALSWMTASGFATALGTFTGQNYGAENWERIRKGFFTALKLGIGFGIVATYLFIFHGDFIFGLFISPEESEIYNLGVVYLLILSISQAFMCLEIISSGAFNGIGRSVPVAITSVSINVARIPLALLFTGSLAWALPEFSSYIPQELVPITGVWWSYNITSILKGVILFIGFLLILKKRPK